MSGWKRQVNARIAAGAYFVPVAYQQTVPVSEKVALETRRKDGEGKRDIFSASDGQLSLVSEGLGQLCITPGELFLKRSTCIVPVMPASFIWSTEIWGVILSDERSPC